MSNDDLITMVVFSGLEIVCLLIMLVAAVKILLTFVRSLRLQGGVGVVVAHQRHQTNMRGASGYGSRPVTLHKPVVRFTAPDGRLIDVLHPVASNRPPAIGSSVPVAFDPRNPSHAEVASGLARYLGAGVTLVAVGIVFAILVGVQLAVLR